MSCRQRMWVHACIRFLTSPPYNSQFFVETSQPCFPRSRIQGGGKYGILQRQNEFPEQENLLQDFTEFSLVSFTLPFLTVGLQCQQSRVTANGHMCGTLHTAEVVSNCNSEISLTFRLLWMNVKEKQPKLPGYLGPVTHSQTFLPHGAVMRTRAGKEPCIHFRMKFLLHKYNSHVKIVSD